MRIQIKILVTCLGAVMLSCSPNKEDLAIREKQLLLDDVEVMEADLVYQQAVMDSIRAVQEIEVAQQIVLNQQLMDLRSKMATEESRLNAGLDSK